jgi:amino acid transporter
MIDSCVGPQRFIRTLRGANVRGDDMQQDLKADDGLKLHRVLGLRDLVLLNIAAVCGLRWISMAAQIGPSSLILWVVALLVFFVPLALAVLELSSRIPSEGGLYVWSKTAFGDLHGFIAGWSYWASNMVFFPSILLFGAGISAHIGGSAWQPLADNALYNTVYCLTVLWGVTALNIVGLERAKWLQNTGGFATWLVAALIIICGIVSWHSFGMATPVTASNLMPDFRSLATFATLATIALAYAGLELGPILGGEIVEPQKTIPRAVLIAGVMIAAIYIAGTLALLIALPHAEIDIVSGIPQALAAVGDRLGLSFFGPMTAVLLTISQLGNVGAWITGTARLPLVVGIDRYLPSQLARIHPKYGTPHQALLIQATIVSIILVASLSSATIHESYLILIDMTLILTFLPLLYLFASLPLLRRRAIGGDTPNYVVPGGVFGCWLVASVGFAATIFAMIISMIPPEHSRDPAAFFAKVVGGSLVLIGIGLAFYARGVRNQRLAAVVAAAA